MRTIKQIKEVGYVRSIYDRLFYNIDYKLLEDAEKRLDNVISKLPDRMSRVFIMRYKECLTYRAIANRLGIKSAQYVTTILSNGYCFIRAREELMKTLYPEYVWTDKTESDIYILGTRIVNRLHRNNIYTVNDLASKTKDYLLKIPGLGVKAVAQIEAFLNKYNMKLSEE